jgi:CIC family chloride channel protein
LAFGGSVGLEAPIVVTGSSWGSNLAKFFRFDFRNRTLLIGCGTAAGISAIFNAPVAGVIFAIEVILPEFSTSRFIPILIAAAMGNLFSSLFIENEAILRVAQTAPIGWGDLFWLILLGIVAGFHAVSFSRIVNLTGKWMKKIGSWWKKALIGGLGLGTIIYFFPPLYGEGYVGIRSILNEQALGLIVSSRIPGLATRPLDLMLFIGMLLFLKPFAAALTVEAGGVGGKFGPSLVTGAYLGYVFAFGINQLFPTAQLSAVNYTLFGMSAILSGVMHAPLTGIFLIAEITGTYDIIVPLMLVSALSYFTKTYFQPLSLVSGGLIRSGDLIHNNKDRMVLHEMDLSRFIEKDIKSILSGSSLAQLVALITRSKRNIFPVVDAENRLLGIILLDDIRGIMFNRSNYESTKVDELMHNAPAEVEVNSAMESVMQLFDDTNAWNLPVVREGIYLGFISKSTIFSAYRKQLKEGANQEDEMLG